MKLRRLETADKRTPPLPSVRIVTNIPGAVQGSMNQGATLPYRSWEPWKVRCYVGLPSEIEGLFKHL